MSRVAALDLPAPLRIAGTAGHGRGDANLSCGAFGLRGRATAVVGIRNPLVSAVSPPLSRSSPGGSATARADPAPHGLASSAQRRAHAHRVMGHSSTRMESRLRW